MNIFRINVRPAPIIVRTNAIDCLIIWRLFVFFPLAKNHYDDAFEMMKFLKRYTKKIITMLSNSSGSLMIISKEKQNEKSIWSAVELMCVLHKWSSVFSKHKLHLLCPVIYNLCTRFPTSWQYHHNRPVISSSTTNQMQIYRNE